MKTKGVLFDLYGTLIVYGDMQKAWAAWYEVFYKTFSEAGLTLSPTQFRPHCQDFFERPEPPATEEPLTVVERRMHCLAGSFGLSIPRDLALQTIEASIDVWHDYVWLDPDATALLLEVKRKRALALVSNFDYSPYVHHLLELHGLHRLFDTVVVSDAVGVRKPEPAIFLTTMQRLCLSATELIHVGDSLEDIEGALEVGIRPVWIHRGPDVKGIAGKYPKVARITALNQLYDILD